VADPISLLRLAARVASKKNRPWIELALLVIAKIRELIQLGQTLKEIRSRPLGDFVSEEALVKVGAAHDRAEAFERGTLEDDTPS
jgi:hypothetical protein